MGQPVWQGDTLVYAPDPTGTSGGASETVNVAPLRGTFTDRSGSVATGGTSQQVAATNTSRNYILVQNISSGDLWVNFGVAAVQDQPSIKVTSGLSIEYGAAGGFIPTGAVNVVGATTGQKFAAKEG